MRSEEPETSRRDFEEAEGEMRHGTSLGIPRERDREGEEHSAASDAEPCKDQAVSGNGEHGFEEGPSAAGAGALSQIASAQSQSREGVWRTDLHESASVDRAMDDPVEAQGKGGGDVDAEGSRHQEREEPEKSQERRKRRGYFRRRKSAPTGRGMADQGEGHFRRRKSVRVGRG